MPRLPELWLDKRMQLIRLHPGPGGRLRTGLFVVFVDELADRAAAWPRASEGSGLSAGFDDRAEASQSNAALAHAV
ncbi:MAG: hypothetical protein ABI949_15055 [Ilumatobacteraceae bacterium]